MFIFSATHKKALSMLLTNVSSKFCLCFHIKYLFAWLQSSSLPLLAHCCISWHGTTTCWSVEYCVLKRASSCTCRRETKQGLINCMELQLKLQKSLRQKVTMLWCYEVYLSNIFCPTSLKYTVLFPNIITHHQKSKLEVGWTNPIFAVLSLVLKYHDHFMRPASSQLKIEKLCYIKTMLWKKTAVSVASALRELTRMVS